MEILVEHVVVCTVSYLNYITHQCACFWNIRTDSTLQGLVFDEPYLRRESQFHLLACLALVLSPAMTTFFSLSSPNTDTYTLQTCTRTKINKELSIAHAIHRF
jgi:hypothetical protein